RRCRAGSAIMRAPDATRSANFAAGMGFALVTAVGWGLNWPVPKYLLTELPLGAGRRSGRSLFDVRFGSKAVIRTCITLVRFAPESGQTAERWLDHLRQHQITRGMGFAGATLNLVRATGDQPRR